MFRRNIVKDTAFCFLLNYVNHKDVHLSLNAEGPGLKPISGIRHEGIHRNYFEIGARNCVSNTSKKTEPSSLLRLGDGPGG